MKANESAKVRYEFVGNPGREVADFSPTELIASKISGKTVAGTIAAGWRTVRMIERRASSGACTRIDGPCEVAGALIAAASIRRPTPRGRSPARPSPAPADRWQRR